MAEFHDKLANFSLSRHYLTAEIGAEFGWSVAVRSSKVEAMETAAASTPPTEFVEGEETSNGKSNCRS